MSTRTVLRGKRFLLSACVSAAAIIAATPSRAADINWTKAAVADHGEFRAFVEGGVFWTGGDRTPYCGVSTSGAFSVFVDSNCFADVPVYGSVPAVRPRLGWDGAIGADYRFAGTPWHVNMEGRYGQTNKIQSGDDPQAALATFTRFHADGTSFTSTVSATSTPLLKETHWHADFGAGYDFLRGVQINFGFRVAEVTSDMTSTINVNRVFSTGTRPDSASDVIVDRRAFFGAGPRVGLSGSVPLFGALSFDYSGNTAILFGNTKFSTGDTFGSSDVDRRTIFATSGNTCCQLNWSAPNTVWNYDIQAGVGYWITPNWKLAVSYRLDAYLDVLRVAPDDGATNSSIGPGRSMDRYYHGPKASLAARF